MAGLGVAEGATELQAGIHLRWAFQPDLGYPPFGFHLYRREHLAGDSSSFPIEMTHALLDQNGYYIWTSLYSITSTARLVPQKATPAKPWTLAAIGDGTITINFAINVEEFSIRETHSHGVVKVDAYDGSVLVGSTQHTASTTPVELAITADRFDRVVIEFGDTVVFYEISWTQMVEPMDLTGWTLLDTFQLPKSWSDAAARIPASLQSKYEDGFTQLVELIRQITNESVEYPQLKPSSAPADWRPDSPAITFTAYPIRTLLLAALDPYIARMLGLYFVDTTASSGVNYDYMIAGRWTSPTTSDYKWIAHYLSLGTPLALAPPTGLQVTPKKLPAGIGPVRTGSATSQMGCGIAWQVPQIEGGQLAAGSPVLYHIHRQTEDAGTWASFVTITEGRPVLVTASAEANTLPSVYYIDGPLDLGKYRYNATGIDLFGQKSAPSLWVEIDLADLVAPPPPIKLKAVLNEETNKIHVSWKWDQPRRTMAADAKEFRVYYQTENLVPVQSYISAVADIGDTSLVETELDPAADYSAFSDGYLINQSTRFRVQRIEVLGTKVFLAVANTTGKEGKKIPVAYGSSSSKRAYLKFAVDPWKAAGRFLLLVDWSNPARWNSSYTAEPVTSALSYRALLEGVPLTVSRHTPVTYALIGVNTVDTSGNVGSVSTPVRVAARLQVKPERPPAPSGEEYATRADYYGKSQYTLTLETEEDLYYEILRATDAVLGYAEYGRTEKAAEIDDDTLLELATSHEDVFASIGARDSSGAVLAGNKSTIQYTDSMPGLGRNRYVYRILAYDKAGNRSALSNPLLVKLHDVTPPRAPVITKILGGDRQITLRWARNRETDFAKYRVYRAQSEETSSDVREMKMMAEINVGTETYTDDVAGLTDYWYRLTAVDTSGNESVPTSKRKGRAYDQSPPEAPVWSSLKRSDDGTEIILCWTSAEELECFIKRRESGSPIYRSISGWISVGIFDEAQGVWTHAYTDAIEIDKEATYVYFITVRNASGNTNESEESSEI